MQIALQAGAAALLDPSSWRSILGGAAWELTPFSASSAGGLLSPLQGAWCIHAFVLIAHASVMHHTCMDRCVFGFNMHDA